MTRTVLSPINKRWLERNEYKVKSGTHNFLFQGLLRMSWNCLRSGRTEEEEYAC